MGVHVCPVRCGQAVWRLTSLVLFQLLVPPAAGRTLQQRFDLRRGGIVSAAPAPATADGTDAQEGSEILVVLKPPNDADDKNSDRVVDDMKFAIANEGMRPMVLRRFLSQHGINPEARLPPLHTVKEGSGPIEALSHSPLNMKGQKAPPAPAPPPMVPPDVFYPAGHGVTPPPGSNPKQPGDLRQELTTQPPLEFAAPPATAGGDAPAPGPAPPTTTLMMMVNPEDAYAVNSARPPPTFIRDEDGHMMECYNCVCTKKFDSGGLQEVEDPTC